MPAHLFHLLAYLICFVLIWFGAGRVVGAVSTLASYWKLPAFTVSFFILGFLTSLPEMAIGFMGLMNNDPQIFAGNLIGAGLVIFLLIIPLLSLVGQGLKFPTEQVNHKELLLILAVVVAPSFLSADQRISYWEGWLLILLYVALALIVSFRHSVFERISHAISRKKPISAMIPINILGGMMLLFFASQQIVNSTLYFADAFQVSPFFVSLVVISLGTNIPELSIIFRSVMAKKSDIALADYLGSAAINTLVFGVLTVIHGQGFDLRSEVELRMWFIVVGFALFFIFARTKDRLSRKEAAILLAGYISFVLYEIWNNLT